MSVLETKQKLTFDHDVRTNLNVSGDITGDEICLHLTRRRNDRASVVILDQADIKSLLPILKELLELA